MLNGERSLKHHIIIMYNMSIRGVQKTTAPTTGNSSGNALGNVHSFGSDENPPHTTRIFVCIHGLPTFFLLIFLFPLLFLPILSLFAFIARSFEIATDLTQTRNLAIVDEAMGFWMFASRSRYILYPGRHIRSRRFLTRVFDTHRPDRRHGR